MRFHKINNYFRSFHRLRKYKFPNLQYDAIYELSLVEGPQIKMSHESLLWES